MKNRFIKTIFLLLLISPFFFKSSNAQEYDEVLYKFWDWEACDKLDSRSEKCLKLLEDLYYSFTEEKKYKQDKTCNCKDLFQFTRYRYSSTLLNLKQYEKSMLISKEMIADKNFPNEDRYKNFARVSLAWYYYVLLKKDKYQEALQMMYDAEKYSDIWPKAYALNNLGVFYHLGIGTKKNNKKAFEYYKKSANLGNYLAHDNVASFYILGRGGEKKNYEKAIRHLKLARIVELGNDNFSQLKLLLRKERLPKDLDEYISWLESFAIEENENHIFQDIAWFIGDKQKVDFIQKYKWFYLSAKLSLNQEQIERSSQEINRLKKFHMNNDEVIKAESLAKDWIKKHR